jgi:glutamate synthase domain-containing protein 3
MAKPEKNRKANITVLDLEKDDLRAVNQRLQESPDGGSPFRILHPRGAHALACGLKSAIDVEIEGHTGYYCAGMNKAARVTVNGNAGVGVAENMMSGEVWVKGDASQSAAATAHGGLLVVEGNTSARCGISLKGADIVVKGNVGHMSMFLAQAGNLVVLGDAGDSLGDSIYEARIYVRGKVASLGADCIEKDMRDEHRKELRALLDRAGCKDVDVKAFRRYGSARQLYNFKAENLDSY